MIDARKHHDPALAPDLIAQAIEVAGTQAELADRLGITPRYLRMLSRREKDISYALQVAIEAVVSE